MSIDDETAAAIERAAAEEDTTFSAWLTRAAQRQLRIHEGLRAVADYEAEVGEITEQEMAAAQRRRQQLQGQEVSW